MSAQKKQNIISAKSAAPLAGISEQGLKRQPFGSPIYNEVIDFLHDEAFLLDENRLPEWLKMLSDDIFYSMPVRRTVYLSEGSGFSDKMDWYHENWDSLSFKVRRLSSSENAYAENPPSRTRRFITNLRLFATHTAEEYLAQSSLYVIRNRGEQHNFDMLSARRDDIVRKTSEGFQISRRTIFVDQSVISTNLAIFL